MPLQPSETILSGKYHILRLIGEGGMARVWLAEETAFGNRQVAIKEPRQNLLPGSQEELQRRYQREVQVCAALDKARVPNVVRAITAEPYEGTLLLVMDFMLGGDLVHLLQATTQGLPLPQALTITQSLLAALSGVHAHALEIVHRDVKPSNILFDDRGTAHLGDFGLAQIAGTSQRSQLQGGTHPGTPLYMAPEQGSSVSYLAPAADLYAFGCVLFEMLTGKRYKRYRPGTLVSSINPNVPKWLDEILVHALSEDPYDRYQSAEEMTQALQQGEKEQAQTTALLREKERRLFLEQQLAVERERLESEEQARRAAVEATERQQREEQAKREADERKQAEEQALHQAEECARSEAEKQQLAAEQAQRAEADAAEAKRKKIEDARLESERRIALEAARQAVRQVEAEERKRQQAVQVRPVTVQKPVASPEERRLIENGESSLVLTLAPGVTMPLVRIPAGEFIMGSSDDDPYAQMDEKPRRHVYLDEYLIGKFTVTNVQFRTFMQATDYDPENRSLPVGKDDHPVTYASFEDAEAFCAWASKVSGRNVYLPTEAQWEKAARGTDGRTFPWGNEPADNTRSNYGDFLGYPTPVGAYRPLGNSPYGCADMAGNVWEWVNDWYQQDYYATSPSSNPPGPTGGEFKVIRGGGWYGKWYNLRVTHRNGNKPDHCDSGVGFRCVVSL